MTIEVILMIPVELLIRSNEYMGRKPEISEFFPPKCVVQSETAAFNNNNNKKQDGVKVS